MNYYKRHLGDYAKDTRHLSLAEHGAYCLLLDYYYATEKPIPDDRCERIANAYATAEREAVRAVLREFFTETPEGWRNRKADEVIGEAQAKSLKAKESAEARWKREECERNANASKLECERNASHKPLANSHKEKKGAAAPDLFPGVNPQVVADFSKHRAAKKAPITSTAVEGLKREARKAGLSLEAAMAMCCERGWTGFKAAWVTDGGATPPNRQRVDL